MSPSDDGRTMRTRIIAGAPRRAWRERGCARGSDGWLAGGFARRIGGAFGSTARLEIKNSLPRASTSDAMSDPLPQLALSLVVITRDAGAQLAGCLVSAAFAAEA